MTVKAEIKGYIAAQSDEKRADLQKLHRLILTVKPGCRLWFLNGKNSDGKVVSNPQIGYGQRTMVLSGGKAKQFYRIGLSANSAGISVYILGFSDKGYLAKTYGKKIGKAKLTAYCVKFRALRDINEEALTEAIRDGFAAAD